MSKSSETIHVPMEVAWTPAWLSWVGAMTSCLRALGVECDTVEVAGMSGYAFHLCVGKGLCPSGPTALEWGALLRGVASLGRSTLVFGAEGFGSPKESEAARAGYREAFAVARREIEAGRPCVIWGAYVPEFAVAVGVQGDCYLVKSFKECAGGDQPPIPFDDLQAPGGPYVLGFPTATEWKSPETDRRAIGRAVTRFRDSGPGPLHRSGSAAYDRWIEELEAHRADAGGNSYNAACYAEGRQFAYQFLQRLAARNPEMADALHPAASDYATAAAAMARVAALFPFSGQYGSVVEDAPAIASAVSALREAREAESRAIERLARVAGEEA